MSKRPSKSVALIRDLLDLIKNNRKKIVCNFMLSGVITAFMMILITNHPTLVTVYDWFQVMWEQASDSFILLVLKSHYEINMFVTLAFTEWKTTSDAFMTLPFIEQTKLILNTFGYFGTTLLIFTCVLILSIPARILVDFIYGLLKAFFGTPKSWSESIHEHAKRMEKKRQKIKLSTKIMATITKYCDKHQNN